MVYQYVTIQFLLAFLNAQPVYCWLIYCLSSNFSFFFFLLKQILSMNQIIWITVIAINDVGAGKYAPLMLWVQN